MAKKKKWSGWLPNPGFQPVADNVRVKLALEDTQIIKGMKAGDIYWENIGTRLDICEYKIHIKNHNKSINK